MRTLTLALAAAALLAAAPAASAAHYTVTGGKLDWTMANQYAGSGDADRTWLGYVTNTVGGRRRRERQASMPSAGAHAHRPDAARAVSVLDGQLPARPRPAVHARLSRGRRRTVHDEGVGSVELAGTFTFTVARHPDHVRRPAGHAQRPDRAR